jgi:hypothetical protein
MPARAAEAAELVMGNTRLAAFGLVAVNAQRVRHAYPDAARFQRRAEGNDSVFCHEMGE